MTLAFTRNRHREEEGESAFVSMTDLTVSFLFILLILLAFFATQFKPEETVPRAKYDALMTKLSEACEAKPDLLAVHLERAASAQAILLERLADQIRRQLPGIRVTVVAADGVIRFRGDDLFRSGQWRIRPGSTAERVARAVGDALADTLPCYTAGAASAFDMACNGAFAAIETIQIEGHTDDVPLCAELRRRERMQDNRDLSARRGAETLRAVTDRYRPELMAFLNLNGQSVLSFAGYGAMRPIDRGDSAEARAANRRIDIRFILQTPQNVREVEEIRARLTQNHSNLPPTEKKDAQ